ncbi:MAG: toxin TcdB middle/N-terminal domain-containing protein, partial [Limisphaerales bacterium]
MPIPHIQRQTDRGIPTYGQNVGFVRDDRFINELKEELVPAASGYFFCKNEGAFVRYRRVGDHWEGTTPTGTRMEFGLTPQARVSNGTNVFSWMLERETDTRGNAITFSYASFPGENNTNQIYLQAVRYGPGAPPWTNFHFARFHYESRPDWFEDCRSGFEVRTGQRLKRIDIGTQGPNLVGSLRGDFDSDSQVDNLVRRYLLQYATNGSASHWSLLVSVTQIGSDGLASLPSARFDYFTCDPPTIVSGQNQVLGSENTPPFVMDNSLTDLVDLNGDGLPDLLKTDAGGGTHTAYLNLGQRRVAAGQHILWEVGEQITGDLGAQIFDLQSDESTGTHSAHLADMDGDGAADFVVKAGSDNVFYFANRNDRRWGPRSQMAVADVSPPAPFGSPNVRTADVDFDKRVDIIRSLGGGLGYHVWFNLGDNAYSDRVLVEPNSGFSFDLNSPAVQIADLNGDRVPDVAQIQPTMVTVTTGLGYGRFREPTIVPIPGGVVLNGEQLSRARLTDLNGDGLADLVVERAEGSDLWYWLNLGVYAFDEQRKITGLPVPTGSAAQIRWADMNGNGTVDYVLADRESVPQIQTVDLGELIGCGSYRNLLNSVANGIGRVTHIGYESSTHYRLLDAAAGNPWPDPTPFPVPVISSITNLDSMGHAYITRFQYHNGFYDAEEKQFRGFARVEQIDVGDSTAPTLVSRSYFDTGRAFETLKGKQLRATFETEDGRVFRDVFTSWQIPPLVLALGTNGQTVSYTHPVGSTNIIKELGQGLERRLESEFAYDQFGNQTDQRDFGIVENENR